MARLSVAATEPFCGATTMTCPVAVAEQPTCHAQMPAVTLGLFGAGTVVFAGSCYASAPTGDRANGRLAPFGGTALIAAWATLLL